MRSIAQINEQVAGKTGLEDGEMAGWRDEKVFPLFFFFLFFIRVCVRAGVSRIHSVCGIYMYMVYGDGSM